jgi:hypothetical protein
MSAAQAGIAETALGRHGVVTLPDSADIFHFGLGDHLLNGRVKALFHCFRVICHHLSYLLVVII